VNLNDKAKAALQQPDTQTVRSEMTPALRDKYRRVTSELIDLLKANTEGPIEAYMILQFVMQSFEENYGIRGAFTIGDEEGPAS